MLTFFTSSSYLFLSLSSEWSCQKAAATFRLGDQKIVKKVKVVAFSLHLRQTGDTKKLSKRRRSGKSLFPHLRPSSSPFVSFAKKTKTEKKTKRSAQRLLSGSESFFSQRAPFSTSLLCLPFVLLQRRRRDLNKHMAPWGKQRDSETNKNASSESLSTTPNDDVNDEEQHERTKMNEQNQRSLSVAKAEMGEKTQPWTKQEDLKLQHMQEKYGNKWATVASQLPGRTGQQCAQRWRHRVNPNIRREKWTKEEDEKVILMMFVLSFSRFKNHRHLSRESREIRRFERRKRETSLSSTSERSRGVETSVLCKRDRVNLLYFSFSRFATKTIIASSRCHHEKSEREDERQQLRVVLRDRVNGRNRKRHLGGLLLFLTKNLIFFSSFCAQI